MAVDVDWTNLKFGFGAHPYGPLPTRILAMARTLGNSLRRSES
ncbi:MAG: hypothetical protein OXB95_09510 [Rhodobacteraceae bacterium]|nr:hypothetical protein [Paracoccaceae bacterium]